jgi:hypothetical protein
MHRVATVCFAALLASLGRAVAPGVAGASDDPAFPAVGKVFSASAVMVGPNLVLTAKHVGVGNITLPGYGTFAPVGAPMLHPDADIMLFRIDNRGMALPWSKIFADPLPDGAAITMVGYGISGFPNAAGTGYDMSLPRGTRRSAPALVSRTEYQQYGSFVPGMSLISILRQNGQGVVANGDSGGGWFHSVGGSAYLVGTTSFHSVWGSWTGANAYMFSSSEFDYYGGGAVSLWHYRDWLLLHGAQFALARRIAPPPRAP